MIDFKEVSDGETWELFARDFLEEYGFYIHSHPSRGADGGKDILVTETLEGHLGTYQLKWLVSCKHYAKSRKSVSETDEMNVVERIRSFGADGFVGFYSTISSSGFAARLEKLRENGDIKDFRIFDNSFISNSLVTGGYSRLLMTYFPVSYQIIKPVHLVCDVYRPLFCEVCEEDLLSHLHNKERSGNIIYATNVKSGQVENVYCVCKGQCDKILEQRLFQGRGLITAWQCLSDAMIPVNYLRYIMSFVNKLRKNPQGYTDIAFAQEKDILVSMAQRTLRFTNNKEMDRVRRLVELSNMF